MTTDLTTLAPLRDYQTTAVNLIDQTYTDGGDRTTYQAPPGTGKTHVAAAEIAGTTGATVFFVPTVSLLSQTIRRLTAALPGRHLLAVSGDTGLEDDIPTITPDVDPADAEDTADTPPTVTGPRVTTDPDVLADLMRTAPADTIVISTYASAHVIADTSAALHLTWDLLICDEAHHTAGLTDTAWALPVDNTAIPAARRLFMTATIKTVHAPEPAEPGELDLQVTSMDDIATYGPQISTLSWRQAINRGVLAPYEIAIIGVTDTAVLDLIADAADAGHTIDPTTATSQLALLRAIDTHPHLRSILAFHNRIADSKQWCEQLTALAAVDDRAADIAVHHVDATTDRADRRTALDDLADPRQAMTVVSNVRVFGEGIDVPSLDAVLFAAPRTSANDLVQIVGRAIRPHPHNPGQKALIILPVIDSDDDTTSLEAKLARSGHRTCWELLATLSEVDEQVTHAVNAHLYRDLAPDSQNPTDENPGVITVDTSMLAVGASLPFELRTLSPVTSHHPVTAARLREHAADTGEANPGRGLRLADGYPLGARVAQARTAFREKRLARGLAKMYEAVPGFEWYPKGSPVRRSDERFVELMELFVEQAGIHAIRPGQKITDPDTGQSVPIGKKANDWTWRRSLPPELAARVEACTASRR
jgi:predicted helicase